MLSLLPFSTRSIYGLLFWSVASAWIVLEVAGWRFKRAPGSATSRDRGTLALVSIAWWLGIILDVTLTLLIRRCVISSQRVLMVELGTLLMLAGIAFRWYCVVVLGKYFTFNVAIHEDQVLVQSGPYRYLRHPSYSGALLTALGFGLALNNWAGLAAVLGGLMFGYFYRIPVEEAALGKALGEQYTQYSKRTWRLIPFVY